MKEEKTAQDRPMFRTHKSVSVEEIMAAGGPTIYGIRSGKTSENLIEAMKKTQLKDEDAFTDEEFEDMLQQLKDTK